jgi:peptidyl-prolyl cis-trans isomerase SurA
MPIKKIQMKSVNSKIALMFFFYFKYDALESHKDSVIVPVKSAPNQRQKIDGIVAKGTILDSDIDKSRSGDFWSQLKDITRCQMLGNY